MEFHTPLRWKLQQNGRPSAVYSTGEPVAIFACSIDCLSLKPGLTWRWGRGFWFCTANCDVVVCSSPPLCADNLCGGAVALYEAGAVRTRRRNPPGIMTVSGRKCHVVRVLMRRFRCGQRTGSWMVKTCRKLSLNSVWMSLMRAAGMSCWALAWAHRREFTSFAASRSVASSNTAWWRSCCPRRTVTTTSHCLSIFAATSQPTMVGMRYCSLALPHLHMRLGYFHPRLCPISRSPWRLWSLRRERVQGT